MSKGSRRRPGDEAAYAAGYERIFGVAAKRLDDLTGDAQEHYGAYRDDSEPKPKNQ